ncbi:MAG TPA: translation initiation factor IF-2 [Gaiellaceae bacterium]|jgi:translation initiation factor IF-2|nr:translation initiation factor IF-2 [Gaiellaceae bacterium]
MANGNGPNRPNRPIRPRQGAPGRKRRVVIDSGAARPRPDSRQRRDDTPRQPKQPREIVPQTGPVTVESGVTVQNLSQALGEKVPKIITILMGLGAAKTVTQSLTDEEVQLIAAEVGREIQIKHAADEEEIVEEYEDAAEDLVERPPVVTIMGHVDHGKTTLLDAIRSARVVETEAGGITQHIGAYQVEQQGRKITFIDTPGHEAFTEMRARGAKVTDIAVLVVAADDGVMPQTKESISHARAAEVPIVVAVNKIDLPDANIDRIKADLAQEGLQPEEWGGSTQFSEVSAKQKQNLDDLLERVLLVADAELELKANPNTEASGPIIESRLDVGRGPVATMLVQRGTLQVGDAVVAGDAWGKVRALYNYKGEKLREARPGDPVEILGFDHPPPAGEQCRVVENERAARHLAQVRGERVRREQLAAQSARGPSLENLFEAMQEGAIQELNLVLKGDVDGSVEAAVSELSKIQHPEVRVNVIHQGVGGITEGDIMLAAASNAMVVGFNVRANQQARQLAEREGVEIRPYRVIYQLTEDIQQALVGLLKPVETEETLGEAEVRQTFRASRVGMIAGCMVTSGVIRRNAQARVIREGTVIYETTIDSLKRFQDDAREVQEGFECGIHLANYDDVKVGDVIEAYVTRQVERTDLSEAATAAPAPTTT